ncbi:MAG: hypothetical protein ABIJ16_10670, partial [Bacteroidota bacterium]
MKQTCIIVVLVACYLTGLTQSPQSFSYQAVVRDATGLVIPDQNVGIRISILQGSVSGPAVYTETHSPTTSSFGLVNLEIGAGSVVLGNFTVIPWGTDQFFVQIELDETGGASYQLMGVSQLLSVPYALYAEKAGSADSSLWKISMNDIYYDEGNVRVGTGTVNSVGKLQVMSDSLAANNDVIFSVQNAEGDTVFAVYQEGVRIWVSDDTSGTKATGSRGGFAVGGISPAKGVTNDYLWVTPDSVRIYIEEGSGSKLTGSRGGFAVGGFSPAKAFTNEFLRVTDDSTRIWTGDSLKGFGVRNIGASSINSYMQLTPANYFIGHDAGKSITTGLFNSFIGYQSGYENTAGNKNYFIGYRSGYNNTDGYSNIFLGDSAGFSCDNAFKNIFIGNQCGLTNVSGNYNVLIGDHAGFNNTTSYNVFIGYQAGYLNNTGMYNVATGYKAMYSNNWGSNNVAIGNQTLYSNTTGDDNTANGNQALYHNITGIRNVAVGQQALFNNSDGDCNVANGYMVLYSNSTGNNNVGIGYATLFANTTGFNNTAVGNNSFSSGSTYSNSTAVGANAAMNNSNKVRLGSATVT